MKKIETRCYAVPIKRIGYTVQIIALLFAISCKQKPTEKPKVERPNVIFVMADQWRAQAMGYAGDENVKTPNLDKLAGEQINFTNAISNCPVCAPTRATILTGQYPLTHGVFYNDKPLNPSGSTLAEIFKSKGYKTGYIGKWHLNGHTIDEDIWKKRLQPVPKERRLGFDYWKVMECTHDYNNSVYFDKNNNQHVWQGYDAEIQTDSAIAFIQKEAKNPFFLFLSWGPPHNPYETAPEKYSKQYAETDKIKVRPNVPDSLIEKAQKQLAGYYAHCTALDEYIGRLQKAIKQANIEDNTIFIFTSDHGDMLQSQAEFKKQKPWDESIKVPFILKYPNISSEVRRINTPFETVDILPTILGLSNIEIPESVEGVDFSPYLLKNKTPHEKAGLIMCPVPFHEWSRIRGGREFRGIRTQRYTYVKDLNGSWLLYDDKEDPYQQRNLVGKSAYVKIEKQLEDELQGLLDRTNDDFKNADYYMKKWGYCYDDLDFRVFKK